MRPFQTRLAFSYDESPGVISAPRKLERSEPIDGASADMAAEDISARAAVQEIGTYPSR
jgi:hypothetical protein